MCLQFRFRAQGCRFILNGFPPSFLTRIRGRIHWLSGQPAASKSSGTRVSSYAMTTLVRAEEEGIIASPLPQVVGYVLVVVVGLLFAFGEWP